MWQKFCWKPLQKLKAHKSSVEKKIISIYRDDTTDINSESEDNDVTR